VPVLCLGRLGRGARIRQAEVCRGATSEVSVAGCVRLRKGGISRSSHVAGTGAVSEGTFGDDDDSSRDGGAGVTSGLVMQCSPGLGGCATAIEDLPAGLVWWLVAMGAGDGGRVTSEVAAVAFDTSGAAQVEDLPAGLLWWLFVVGLGGGARVTPEATAALELDG
jgi:hypothetical protein